MYICILSTKCMYIYVELPHSNFWVMIFPEDSFARYQMREYILFVCDFNRALFGCWANLIL